MTIQVCVPYTQVQEATRAYLLQEEGFQHNVWPHEQVYPPIAVQYFDVSSDPWSYTDYLQQRWDEGQTFVNIEHDIVPWPGAIANLLLCPRPWCFFGYLPTIDMVQNGCANLGLMKFSSDFINAVPDIWREMHKAYDECCDPKVWTQNDIFLWQYAVVDKKHVPHQHWPSVFNSVESSRFRPNKEVNESWELRTSANQGI